MDKINDGGPAFPVQDAATWQGHGMAMRDLFAASAPPPAYDEICLVAGVGYENQRVYIREDDTIGMNFLDWWRRIPLARRMELTAKVRYAYADAMLKERGL